ncbi:hypothetical protein [Staphylococcus agnetis]|uniref:hypothetical protein n=1 Tax=Staphylococcus agnetis TaxID=985762 RepID=UPI00208FC45D|nr:hypothetical protein [Staphylococcus agnetis]MCO4365774.1 hypothetical protein [Staphylococcus agnetis]
MDKRSIEDINREIEKELLEYQNDSDDVSHFSWPKAFAYILVIFMFFLPILIHIFAR